jgi:dTDP-4-dehydrorhamnose 3,5-epimerase
MPFCFEKLEVGGAILIEPRVFADERGFFLESYRQSDFAASGIPENFVQENHSRSRRGILRGLHYQLPPRAQAKLVRVVVGEVLDVAVDMRKGSPTFGKWVGVNLSAENRRLLYLPPTCAHGFCVISDVAEVIYKVTEEYSPEWERGICWNDSQLAIQWPVEAPTLSDRDQRWPAFAKMVETWIPG